MRKRMIGMIIAVALLAVPAWGVSVNVQDFLSKVGVRLAASGKSINIEEGQTIKATVGNPATLAARGLPGTKAGEGILVGAAEKFVEEFKFTLTHELSGKSVSITYRPK